MSKTILVTGAAGFIGSHVAQLLFERGDVVVGLDNLNDYYDPNRKRANLDEVRSTPAARGEFHFVEGDLRDTALLKKLCTEYSFDAIVNLAAMAGVRASVEDPQLYFDVNLGGTLSLLNMARDYKIGNFVLASTSSVYGNTTRIPFIETDQCDQPLAPYAASKRAAEMLGYTYHHLYQQNFSVLRFFTVYGPRGRPDMMTFKVLDNIFSGQTVPLYNNGQMYRDWTYVGDIARGVVAAADRPLGYEIFNLGRGLPVLLAEFVALLEEVTGRKANLQSAPMMDTDMSTTYADTSKAQHLLGYEPQVSVREGVEEFWRWYRQQILGQP